MTKQIFDNSGKLITVTKKLKIFVSETKGETWSPIFFSSYVKDTEDVLKVTEKLREYYTNVEKLIYGTDYKFEVEDV